jgi:SHS2 domain-containing protein
MGYEILRHTADEKFRAEGDSLEEAFKHATKAFSDIVKGGAGETKHTIKIESESHEALLFDYLDKLIFLQDTESIVVSHAKNIEITEKHNKYTLTADIITDPITTGTTYTDVKAPTYNEMKATYENGAWILEAVIDI